MKKGLVFTLGLAILALVILSLSILVKDNFLESEKNAQLSIINNRIYGLDNSIQKTIREIFNEKTDITVLVEGNSVSINETIPASSSNSFSNEIDNLKAYLENSSNFPAESINISKDNLNKLPIDVFPFEFRYSHENYGDDNINLTYNTENLESYDFSFFKSLDNGTVSFTNFQEGSFPITLVARSEGGYIDSMTENVDLSQQVRARIKFKNGFVNVNFDGNAASINKNFADDVVATTKVSFNDKSFVPEVFIPDIIKIEFEELGLEKVGGVKIY